MGPLELSITFFQKYNKTSPIKLNSAPYMKKLPPGAFAQKTTIDEQLKDFAMRFANFIKTTTSNPQETIQSAGPRELSITIFKKIEQNQPHQVQFCSLPEKAAVSSFCTKDQQLMKT